MEGGAYYALKRDRGESMRWNIRERGLLLIKEKEVHSREGHIRERAYYI